MAFRSLLVTSLLAAGVIAGPPGYGSTKTVTTTDIKTKYKTITETIEKIKTKTKTETVTAYSTSVSTMSITGSCSLASTSASASANGTSTSSSATNTNPTTTLLATPQPSGVGLNEEAKKDGKLWFGTAADIPGTGELQDSYYMTEFNNTLDFGEATPANVMKFVYTEPEQGVFNYTDAQTFLDIAHASGKLVRCHNLIWANQLPTWVTNPTTNWTNATLSAVLYNHAYTLVSHFGDQCYSWDVVNEALSDSPAGAYSNSIWYQIIGPEYFPMAFKAASDAVRDNNLSVKLYYNDYNIEYPGPKATAAQNLVKELQARGIQIDGVGLESHFIAGETPSMATQVTNMNNFTSLGINVAVTELDVRLNLPANASTEAQQVSDYYNTVAACVAVSGCIGVTVWDFDDTYSWIPGTFPGQGYGDIFLQPAGPDTPLVKKAAYDGCLQALQHQPESA